MVDIDDLLEAIGRVTSGGFAVDPDVVGQLMQRSSVTRVLDRLTPENSRFWNSWRRAGPTGPSANS